MKLFQFTNLRVTKKSIALISLAALVLGGLSAQASGILNTPAGGYLVCVDTKTGALTHPGTTKCKKGQKRLVLGAQGPAGATGANGQDGLVGASGLPGKSGNTLWSGNGEPSPTLGIPGDSYLDLAGKKIHAPKAIDGSWPVGISIVGPQGPGGIGPAGAAGAAGPAGAAGAAGPAGAAGATGISAPVAFDSNCTGLRAECSYKIGDTGPGGGVIFFVDYNNVHEDFDYLEVATDECIRIPDRLDPDNRDRVTRYNAWTSETSTAFHPPTAEERAWLVGSGAFNTAQMLTNFDNPSPEEDYIRDVNGAAAWADALICGGQVDWFLGSFGEMKLMLEASLEVSIPNSLLDLYWTSTSSPMIEDKAIAVDLGFNRSMVGNTPGVVTVYELDKDGEDGNPFIRPIRRF